MAKRLISVTLALILVFGIFMVPSAGAADVKILGTKTLTLDQTANLSLTDPDTGKKLDLIWESSDPSVATITSDGKVTPHKVGTCVMTTTWNNKWYGINVKVVSNSSSSGSSGTTTPSNTTTGKTSAFTKLKNYLIKNGTKSDNLYFIKWENSKYRYWVSYNASSKYMEYVGVIRNDADSDKGKFEVDQYETKNKVEIIFFWNKNGRATNNGVYGKTYKKSSFNIKSSVKLKHESGKKYSNANSLANKYRKQAYPVWEKWLKSKAGVTLKSLGLMKSKKAKKITLSKKSATLKKGKTLKLKLKNAKASKVKWSSSKKKVATVSKKGVVKAKKKGKATITAKYKGKKYKCKITVKKGGMTAAQAYNKLKKYIKKKGQKKTYSDLVKYSISWKINSFSYEIYYDEFTQGSSQIVFIGDSNNLEIILFIDPDKSNFDCSFYKYKNDYNPSYDMELSYPKKSFILEKIPNFQFYDNPDKAAYNEANLNAKATLEWMFPEFDSYIKSKAGVTMKQLGFKKWK